MTDSFTIRLVVASLALIAVMCVAGAIYLTANDKNIPDAIIGFGMGSVGAVSGILARTSSGKE